MRTLASWPSVGSFGRTCLIGVWRSPVARLLWEQEVPGSNPGAPTLSDDVRALAEMPEAVLRPSSGEGRRRISPAEVFIMPIRSKAHADLVDFYRKKVPKLPGEADQAWQARIEANPGLVKEALRTASPSEQIKLLAMRRALAMAGGRRAGGAAGPNNVGTASARFLQDTVGVDHASRERFARAQIEFLKEAFNYGSPRDGSIFWTGVDPAKLVNQVRSWNARFGTQLFGQLEATTDAQYIDGAFDWHVDGAQVQATQMFFGAVSAAYGHRASGHVTSVQMWGLRNDSIFTRTELPTILRRMSDQIARNQQPDVTDISIVVLDPKTDSGDYKIFTNNEIADVAIVQKTVPDHESRWIRGRQDCGIADFAGRLVPVRVRGYWLERGRVQPSAAAQAIVRDYPLIKRS